MRDYRGGERYAPRPVGRPPLETAEVPPPTDMPRLILDDGTAAPPSTEPAPNTAIDRLLLVPIRAATRSGAHVVLRGACTGTMADIVGMSSCVDTENTLVAVTEEVTTPDTSLPATSLAGTFSPATPCSTTPRPAGNAADGTPLNDDEVCVPGAMFLFGSYDGFGMGQLDDVPRRVAILAPFLMDRYEVTVARWRDAIAHGFESPDASPVNNPSPLVQDSTGALDPSRRVHLERVSPWGGRTTRSRA